MIKRLFSRIKLRALERQRAICRQAWDDAVQKRDTRRQHEAYEAAKKATTEALKLAVGR